MGGGNVCVSFANCKHAGSCKGVAMHAHIEVWAAMPRVQGAIAFKAPSGAFKNRISLDFWVYMGSDSQPSKGLVAMLGGSQVGSL